MSHAKAKERPPLPWPQIEPVPVPVVRFWLPAALDGWNRFLYPPRRRFWFAWGWLLLVVGFFMAAKAAVYVAGIVLLFALAGLSALFDIATYYPVRSR